MTTPTAVTTALTTQFVGFASAVAQKCLDEDTPLVEVLADFVITHEPEYVEAGEFLLKVKEKLKALDAERTKNVRPLNDTVKEVNNAYRPAIDLLKTAETRLKAMMSGWALKKQREQQVLLLAASEAARAEAEARRVTDPDDARGDVPASRVLISEAQDAGVKKIEGISTAVVWKWELIDESLVPREFLSVDRSKVEAAVKSGAHEIPGVRVFEDVRITGRTK